jgi:predicted DNA-binding protein
MSTMIAARIPDSLMESLEKVAKYLDRSKSYITTQALKKYLEEELEDMYFGELAMQTEKESNGERITWEEAEKLANEIRNV